MAESYPAVCPGCGAQLPVPAGAEQEPPVCPSCGRRVVPAATHLQEGEPRREQAAEVPAADVRYSGLDLPRWEDDASQAEVARHPDIRLATGSGGESLAVLALLLPLLVQCFFFFHTFASEWTGLAIGAATVLVTAILLTIDAAMLGSTDIKGRTREGPGMLFLGMVVLWIVFYPVTFFRRRHFGRPNLGWFALVVALVFVGGPFLKGILVEGVFPGGGPPSCTSATIVRMLDDMIRKSPMGHSVTGISDHRELSYDRLSGTRKGLCVVQTTNGPMTITYSVSWVNERSGTYQLQILSGIADEPPSCTDREVVGLVERLIRDSPLGNEVRAIEGFRETRYDRAAKARFGQCTVRTNRGDLTVSFKVHVVDQNTGQFEVRLLN